MIVLHCFRRAQPIDLFHWVLSMLLIESGKSHVLELVDLTALTALHHWQRWFQALSTPWNFAFSFWRLILYLQIVCGSCIASLWAKRAPDTHMTTLRFKIVPRLAPVGWVRHLLGRGTLHRWSCASLRGPPTHLIGCSMNCQVVTKLSSMLLLEAKHVC